MGDQNVPARDNEVLIYILKTSGYFSMYPVIMCMCVCRCCSCFWGILVTPTKFAHQTFFLIWRGEGSGMTTPTNC